MTAYARLAPIWITAAVLVFAPPADALIQVDAGAVGVGGERVRHQDGAVLVERDDVLLGQRAVIGLGQRPAVREGGEELPAQR
jgi:hypothetical protein